MLIADLSDDLSPMLAAILLVESNKRVKIPVTQLE